MCVNVMAGMLGVYVKVCISMQVCLCVGTCTCRCTCMSMCMCMYTCACPCVVCGVSLPEWIHPLIIICFTINVKQ